MTGKPMDFTPEVEYEVIREAVSHKLDRHIINPSNKVWRDSTQTKTPNSPLQVGDSLRYPNEVQNGIMELVDINTNDTNRTNYRSKLLRGNTKIVTKEFLKLRNVPGMGSITISQRIISTNQRISHNNKLIISCFQK